MKKILNFCFLFFCGLSLFGQALPLINVGTSANDHSGDPNRTAWQKTNSGLTKINNAANINTVAVMLADSNIIYVTPAYFETHSSGSGGWTDSLSVLSYPPATGNVYINSIDKKIHYLVGGYWHRVAIFDSVAVGDVEPPPDPTYGSELITTGDMSSLSIWDLDNGTTITGGAMVVNSSDTYSTLATESISIELGKTYKIEFDISGYSSGKISFGLGSITNTVWNSTQYSSDQHVNVELVFNDASAPAQIVFFSWDVNPVLHIDNVSVKEVL